VRADATDACTAPDLYVDGGYTRRQMDAQHKVFLADNCDWSSSSSESESEAGEVVVAGIAGTTTGDRILADMAKRHGQETKAKKKRQAVAQRLKAKAAAASAEAHQQQQRDQLFRAPDGGHKELDASSDDDVELLQGYK
jgi:hypothetical protein